MTDQITQTHKNAKKSKKKMLKGIYSIEYIDWFEILLINQT